MSLYEIQLAAWVFQAPSKNVSARFISFRRPPSSLLSFFRHYARLPCTLRSFFIFLIRSPRSRPTSLVSRSQARSLMELFRRTISRAGSAFFIEH